MAAATAAAAALGGSIGNAPAKDRGKLWAAAAAAACTVAESERREVESGGTQGAMLPAEGTLRVESAWAKVAVRRAEPWEGTSEAVESLQGEMSEGCNPFCCNKAVGR